MVSSTTQHFTKCRMGRA